MSEFTTFRGPELQKFYENLHLEVLELAKKYIGENPKTEVMIDFIDGIISSFAAQHLLNCMMVQQVLNWTDMNAVLEKYAECFLGNLKISFDSILAINEEVITKSNPEFMAGYSEQKGKGQ